MDQRFTNRQEIAGLPALSVISFLAYEDTDVSVQSVADWFHLRDEDAWATACRLEGEGLIERLSDDSGDWVKSVDATEIVSAHPLTDLSNAEYDQLVVALVRAVADINSSPATAHRVQSLTFHGAVIGESDRSQSIFEAVVVLVPLATVEQIQKGIEDLASAYADEHGIGGESVSDTHERSIQVIKEALWSAGDRLSLRFVIEQVRC